VQGLLLATFVHTCYVRKIQSYWDNSRYVGKPEKAQTVLREEKANRGLCRRQYQTIYWQYFHCCFPLML